MLDLPQITHKDKEADERQQQGVIDLLQQYPF